MFWEPKSWYFLSIPVPQGALFAKGIWLFFVFVFFFPLFSFFCYCWDTILKSRGSNSALGCWLQANRLSYLILYSLTHIHTHLHMQARQSQRKWRKTHKIYFFHFFHRNYKFIAVIAYFMNPSFFWYIKLPKPKLECTQFHAINNVTLPMLYTNVQWGD